MFPNGTALNYDEVTAILNSEEVYVEYGYQLTQLGFTGIVSKNNNKIPLPVLQKLILKAEVVVQHIKIFIF